MKSNNSLTIDVSCDTTELDIALEKVEKLESKLNKCLNLIQKISIPPVEINEKRSETREPARV